MTNMLCKKLIPVFYLLFCSFLFISCTASHKVSQQNTTARSPLKSQKLKQKYATILQVTPKKIKDKKLYYFIEEWKSVKYKYGGNDMRGVDCSGFTKQLYQNVYNQSLARTTKLQSETTYRIKKKRKLREGDLIFFRSNNSKMISHAGVYLKNGFFVHSATTKGVMISNLNDTYWDENFVSGGKLKR